jgi:hypothetical protein
MSARSALVDVSIVVFVAGVVPYALYRLVRYTRKRTKGAYALGAVLLQFGFLNLTDPENRAPQEARELKKREEDDAGDPPNE